MERVIRGLRIECVEGDITKQADVDASGGRGSGDSFRAPMVPA